MTRVLTRTDLLTLLEPAACVDVLAAGFRATADGEGATPAHRVVAELPFPGTATALIPGVLPGVPAYTVKVNAKFPGAAPALRGVVCLHSGTDGELLALLDSATVTAWRTGLAAALGTHVLARPDATTVGVIGAGAQAELMLRGLKALRQTGDVWVHDVAPSRAREFAARHDARTLSSPAAIAEAADIVLLATWSRTPLLGLADSRPGQHFTTLGADEPGKLELAPDLLEAARLFVDDRELASVSGVLGSLNRAGAAPTLGEALKAGTAPAAPGARTVYAPVGLPWQDLALAWQAYEEAERRGLGGEVNLLG
ncbi:ornithine cyclodeaminase family protein [Streptomyces sp. VRA16 Mangrove soil]|uniref:ornithine cyclodeaminase family protein n=1 Tax=Streptomyces sp. VRA16 Mangrove soil TaxID=2817434 RepID=UPI001A9E0D07|nr:NAD(P)-binding domain-containing protein [Streptomyces sp. VRA16 Mangrove soil]MBO1334167.1 ornithine cyclodeaminase family protein [Streptomyces sp. VRA16 Mangrove soil]